jgi:hypothetical protein
MALELAAHIHYLPYDHHKLKCYAFNFLSYLFVKLFRVKDSEAMMGYALAMYCYLCAVDWV